MFVEIRKQPGVELLDLVVALLIEGVNGPFTLGDETLRGPWPTHTVFDMPQVKIAQMQLLRPDESLGWPDAGGCWLLRPHVGERLVQWHHVHDQAQLTGQQRLDMYQQLLEIATRGPGALCHEVSQPRMHPNNHVPRAKLARQLAVRSTVRSTFPRAKLARQLAVRSTSAVSSVDGARTSDRGSGAHTLQPPG